MINSPTEIVKFNDVFKNLASDHIYISLGDGCFIILKRDDNQINMEYELPIYIMNSVNSFIGKWEDWRDLTQIQLDIPKKFISLQFGNYFSFSCHAESIITAWNYEKDISK